jgi:hypothetical protein
VEIPIRLKVLRSPFFTEVTYLSTASPGSSGASSVSLSASSRIVERTVWGQIALAPYPRRSAKWMTSRGSPLSTTIDACVRRPLRIRWWCSPAVASSDGIGARAAFMFLSVRMRRVAPPRIALSAWTKSLASAVSRALPSPPAGKRMSRSAAARSGWVDPRSRSMSSGVRIGWTRRSMRQCSGVSSRRFRSLPMKPFSDITNSSRSGSIGGFVTWAKSCLK